MKEKRKGGEVGKACDKKVKLTITTCQKGKNEKKNEKGGKRKRCHNLLLLLQVA